MKHLLFTLWLLLIASAAQAHGLNAARQQMMQNLKVNDPLTYYTQQSAHINSVLTKNMLGTISLSPATVAKLTNLQVNAAQQLQAINLANQAKPQPTTPAIWLQANPGADHPLSVTLQFPDSNVYQITPKLLQSVLVSGNGWNQPESWLQTLPSYPSGVLYNPSGVVPQVTLPVITLPTIDTSGDD